MSNLSKTIKRAAKVILTVVAVAAVIYGVASVAGSVAGAGSAPAGTGSLANAAASTAAMQGGGAAATGGGMLSGIGSAIGSMAPMTKSTLLMMGGNMVSGALQPTEAENYKDMREAQIASIQGTSGIYGNGGIGQGAPTPATAPTQEDKTQPFQPTSNIGIKAPEIQATAAPTTSSTVRFDPGVGRFVS